MLLGVIEGPESGLRELKQALAIHLEVTRRHPTVSAFRDDLARTYAEIGDLERRAGDRASALRSVRRGLEIREGLARDNPGVFWYQNQVAASHLNIGIIESESGDCAAAERSYRLARAIQSPLVVAHPETPKLADTLGLIAYYLGQAQLALGRPAEAVAAIEEAIRHHRAASAVMPGSVEFRHHLADDQLALARARRAWAARPRRSWPSAPA